MICHCSQNYILNSREFQVIIGNVAVICSSVRIKCPNVIGICIRLKIQKFRTKAQTYLTIIHKDIFHCGNNVKLCTSSLHSTEWYS